MIDLAYSSFGLTRLPFLDAIDAVARAGYAGMEIAFHRDHFNPFDLGDDDLGAVKHRLARAGDGKGYSMLTLNSTQRQYLRRTAHNLRPVVQIGKQGLTSAVINAVDSALTTHELIKVKFGDFKDEKVELSDQLADATSSTLVALVGNVAILYREHPDKAERTIILPD